MLKHFNIGTFLITLRILSVAHSLYSPPNTLSLPNSPSFQSRQDFPTNSNSDAYRRASKQRPFSLDELDQIDAQVRNLKGMNNNKPTPKETVLKCITYGQSRIINAGEKCDGALHVTTKFLKQDTPQSGSTSEKNLKSPLSNPNNFKSSFLNQNNLTPPLLKQDRFNSPSPSQNIFSSPKSDQNRFSLPLPSEDSSRPSPIGKDTPNVLKPTFGFKYEKCDSVPSRTTDPEDYSDLAKLIDSANGVDTNEPDGMMQASQNNPSIPEGKKLITRDGQQYIASMPEEKPVQKHSYENSVGLTKDEVRDIRNQVFKQANFYRQRHGFNLLTLNENMNNHAQEWANYLASKRILRQRKSGENDLYGETLYESSPTEDIGKVAADTWYNQLRFIHVDDNDEDLRNNPNIIGHMIQLLWKKSREMGVGVAKSDNGEYFIVADYNPKGDVYPFFLDNLPAFEQKDIDAARKANEALDEKVRISKLENGHLGKMVINSDSVDELNGLQQHTNGRPISQSIDPNESPKRKELGIVNGVPQFTQLPEAIDPISFVDAAPLGLSRNEVEQIRKDVLAKSNYYRQKYGMPSLVLHKEIDHYAQDWANTLARTNEFRHRFYDGSNSIYGENIHKSPKILHLGEVAVDLWYYEVGLLHTNDNDKTIYDNDAAGHVTQLLWKSSKQMGVGAAVNGKGNVIVVANYNPKGNVRHFYLENLPRFTQEQIDEGKKLQKVIDELKSTPRTVSTNGELVKLPRWYSKLYSN